MRKRLIIGIVVVVACAIAAGAAYALFTSSTSSAANNLGTGNLPAIGLNGAESTVANFTGLIPANGPTSPSAKTETIQVTGDATMPLNIALSAASDWGAGITDYIDVQVVVNGGSPVYYGNLTGLNVALGQWGAGSTYPVTITVWLDVSAGNTLANLNGGHVTFTFTGTQVAQ
jgi:hypothetical protein